MGDYEIQIYEVEIMKVIVIGSGLSGLTAGALMAKEGHSVKLFEQHEKIGGVCSSIEKDGFIWDYGQMLVPDLGKDEPGRKILEKLGVSDEVKVRKGYRLNYFPDFWISKPTKYKGIYWRKKFFKGLLNFYLLLGNTPKSQEEK